MARALGIMVDVDNDDDDDAANVVPNEAVTDDPAKLLLISTTMVDDASFALATLSMAAGCVNDDGDTDACDCTVTSERSMGVASSGADSTDDMASNDI